MTRMLAMLGRGWLVAALLFPWGMAVQAAYPEKPVRLVVGFPAGSQPDMVARLLGEKLSATWGKAVVIENVTGAAGNIAADRVAKAAPDGYTLGLLSQTHMVVNPSLYKLSYDPVADFAPVSQVVQSPNVLVVYNELPARTVSELVALARARPGALTFASSGSGSGTHMAAESFKSTAAIEITHIPYKGVVAAVPDLMAGRVHMMFSPIPVVLPLVRAGKLRALAVTSAKRTSAVPDLPTVAESGYPGFEATTWYGVLAPAGTPAPLVRTIQREIVRALAQPDLHARLAELGLDVIGNTSEEFAAAIKAEIPRWARVIEEAHIKAE